MTRTRTAQHAWILACGTELTLGHSVDTNSAWLAQKLAGIGIEPDRVVVVPDSREGLAAVLREAAAACDLILLTGGLGPTADDLTRAALADVAGVPLEIDAASLEHIRAFFAERGRTMSPLNQVQALLPRGARALANICGTAPGISLDLHGTLCFAMPGVPFEMQTMFEHEVLPELAECAAGRVLLSRSLHCFGRGESDIGYEIRDLMAPGRNPLVGTRAGLGAITLRIDARAAEHLAAQAMLDELEAELRRRLGNIIYGRGDETLPSVIGGLLVAAGQTVSVAESCTGGLLGKLLTEVPGSSRYFLGGVISYADQIKTRLLGVSAELLRSVGAVSPEVAQAMASGVAAALGSDWALSITGIAGPAGGSPRKPVGLVYIGLKPPAQTSVSKELHLGEPTPREVVRERAARSALNLLRLALLRAKKTENAIRRAVPNEQSGPT
jgi:nicotinamide-nucleotide amidase